MSFSVINGRLRRIPNVDHLSKTNNASTNQDESRLQSTSLHNDNPNSAANQPSSVSNYNHSHNNQNLFSIAPFTLPPGFITIHECSQNDSSRKVEDESHKYHTDVGDYYYDVPNTNFQKVSFKEFNVKGIHKVVKKELIIDHCWNTMFLNEGINCEPVECADISRREKDKHKHLMRDESLILAILTRGFGGSKLKNVMNENKDQDKGKSDCMSVHDVDDKMRKVSNLSCVATSIHLYQQVHDQQDIEETKMLHLHTIHISSFATAIQMEKDLILVSTSSGLLIYDLRQLLNDNLQNLHNNSIPSTLRPCATLCDTYHVTTLMPSWCIHASHISFPYLILASGDTIVIYNLEIIMETGIESKMGKGKNLQKCFREELCNKSIVWSTTIRNNPSPSRITSLYLTSQKVQNSVGSFFAASCWDGSVLVFECIMDDVRDGQEWQRVESDDFDENAEKNEIQKIPPIWEKPTLASGQSFFPTFLTIFCPKTSKHDNIQYIMAVSTPGSTIIRFFDLNKKKPSIKIGSCGSCSKHTETHGLIVSTPSQNEDSCEDLYHNENIHVIWIDNDDMTHIHKW